MSSSSFLSCLKNGGGIDMQKVFHYFDEVDRDNQTKTFSWSRSSLLLVEAFNFDNVDDKPIAKANCKTVLYS